MRNLILKISFNNAPKFNTNQYYTFHSPDGKPIQLQFKSLSRVDGKPIFELNPNMINISTPLDQITYNNIKPISIELITPIHDYNSINDHNYKQNKEILTEFLFELYEIDESKLMTKDGLKEIIRDIKLMEQTERRKRQWQY